MNKRQHLIRRYKVLRKRSRRADDGTSGGIAKSVRLRQLASDEYWRIIEKPYRRLYREWVAVKEALRLLAVLPDDIPAPEVDVVHDGSILLDWQVNPNQVFTLSLSGNHCIPYAWMNGLERGSALAKFYRDQAPQILVQTLREIVNG